MKRPNVTRVVAFSLLIVAACGSEQVSYSGKELVDGQSEPLWANTNELWNSSQVDVCWEPATIPPLEEQNWVRNAIARTWSFAGNLEFTGWGECPPTSAGLRIQLRDHPNGPQVNYDFGKNLAGKSPGLYLDHTFNNFQVSPSTPLYSFVITCTSTSTPAQRRECIENIAIHEFGHVLGFHHEQNAPGASSAPDFPSSCSPLVSSDTGNELYNNHWDLNSVMNYCSPAYGGPRLSALDFAGMQHFYGTSPRFVAAMVGSGII